MSNLQHFKQRVTDRLAETRAYFPLRRVYHTVFNRKFAKEEAARRGFYGQFVNPGCLVFDLGANVGEYANMFLELGARVVAVEPNPWCCRRILALGQKDRLFLTRAAAGDKKGTVTLYVGDYDGHSTVSPEWMQRASQNDPGFRWSNSLTVEMTTLDQLKEQYGAPAFIKIDVEGNELDVLRGMSYRPQALCFEFHTFTSEVVQGCLSLPIFDTGCVYNICVADQWQFIWSEWRSKGDVLEYTSTVTDGVFGDIYVRFLPQ